MASKKVKATGGEIAGGAVSGAGTGAAIGSAIPGVGTAIGAGVGALVGGVASAFGRDKSPAELAQEEALRRYNAVKIPNLAKTIPNLKYYEEQIVNAPTLEAQQAIIKSAMEDIPETDPAVYRSQMQALGQLQQLGKGADINDFILTRQIQNQAATAARGQREAVKQGMEARGMGSSGAALAAQMMAGQAEANRASADQLEIARQAALNRRGSILQGGQLATELRKQARQEDEAKASAQDVFNKFNTELAANINMRNVNRQNLTEAERLAERRAAAMSKTDAANEMIRARANLPIVKYNAEIAKAAGAAGINTNLANAQQAASAAHGANLSNIFSGVQGLATTGIDAYKASQKEQDELAQKDKDLMRSWDESQPEGINSYELQETEKKRSLA